MLLRQRLPELDREIRIAVRKEVELGSSQAAIAELLGVSKQRVNEMVSF